MMETNTKRLDLIIKFIDIALVIIVLSTLFSFYYAIEEAKRFIDVTKTFDDSERNHSTKVVMGAINYVNVVKVVVARVFYALLLIYIRKVVKSILRGELFKEELAHKIRKIGVFILYFGGLLMFFNLIYILAAYNKHNPWAFKGGIMMAIAIFENYVLMGLIIFGMAEVFVSGRKIREEQDLTI